MKNLPYLFLLTLALLLAGANPSTAQTNSAEDNRIVGVTTSKVEALAFLPSRNAPARVEALNHSRIPAEISAVVESFAVRVGDQFKKGDLLAELDCKDRQLELSNQNAQLARLTENLEFERRQFVRGKKLAAQKTIGEAELDRLKTNELIAEAQLNSQRAMHNSAEIGVQRCQILAPFNGITVGRIANVGEMVSVGSAIIEIVELDNSEVSVLVSLADAESFLGSNSFELESEGKRYSLKRRVLLPVVEETSRTREARLDFESTTALAGIAGRLYWYSPFYHLPANLLQQRNNRLGLFVMDGEKASFIETPNAQEGRPILLSDFERWRGKTIIVDGRHGLIDGQSVKPTKTITTERTDKPQSNQPKEG